MINMPAIGERIRRIRTQVAQASQEAFADQMCMTQSNLSMIETQRFLPSCPLLYRLHTTYRINLNWLLTGQGEMRLGEEAEARRGYEKC